MKKAIPISLILMAASLIGFVILQTNWAYNIAQTQEQKIISGIQQSVREAADSLGSASSFASFRLRNPSSPYPSFNLHEPIIKINQRFTQSEVDRIIRKVLSNNDLKNYDVAYCIYFGSVVNGIPEYSTANFDAMVKQINNDSAYRANSANYSYPVNPQMDISGAFIVSNEMLTIIMPNISEQAWRSLIWIMVGSVLLTLITVLAFYLAVRTMLQQQKLNKMKNDFINNMTHEFKTPIATISLAVDALHSPKVQGKAEQTVYFSDIIKEENKKMNKHVEAILQAAFMEKQELSLNTKDLHVHEIISRLVDTFALQLQDKEGEIIQHLNAKNDVISGDEVHINSLINNLIDNAVKYSKPDVPPQIVITTSDTAKNLVIQIKDNGIGMSKDAVKRIFEKFYREHTGNLHNVKGFGLGMSYVKDIITAHKGRIKVDSNLGKGSTFTVELPLAEE